MAVTPNEISEKSFNTKMRGYNPDEVDEFLDYLMDEIAGMIDDHDKLQSDRDKLLAERDRLLAAAKDEPQVQTDGFSAAEQEDYRLENEQLMTKVEDMQHQLRSAQAQLEEERNRRSALQATAPVQPVVESESKIAAMEMAISETLRAAQKAASDVLETANRKAGEIVGGAEEKLRKERSDLEGRLTDLQMELAATQRKIKEAKSEHYNWLSTQMKQFGDAQVSV